MFVARYSRTIVIFFENAPQPGVSYTLTHVSFRHENLSPEICLPHSIATQSAHPYFILMNACEYMTIYELKDYMLTRPLQIASVMVQL